MSSSSSKETKQARRRLVACLVSSRKLVLRDEQSTA